MKKPSTELTTDCPEHGPEVKATKWRDSRRPKQVRLVCTQCERARQNDRHRSRRVALVKEAGGCCSRCGYSRYVGALHFHHIDPSQKEFGISSRTTRNIENLREEVAKCILLCANCHAEVHAEENNPA